MRSLAVIITALILNLSLTGCATQMPGIDAVEISPPAGSDGDIEVAMDEMDVFSSGEYQAFKVSIKNNRDTWLRLEKTNIAFPRFASQPEFLLGNDLIGYLQSVKLRNDVYAHNVSLALGSAYAVGVVGGAVAAHNGNRDLALGGLGLAAGAVTYAAVDKVLESKDRAEFQSVLPEQHFLKPFDIAPKMVVSRWMIVKIKNSEDYGEARVELTAKDSAKRNFLLTSSKAQKEQMAVQKLKSKR
jgi:hypothetical protein